MDYQVKISPFAITQLYQTSKYISEILLAPETAIKLLNKLEKEILTLNSLPNRFPLTEEEPWKTNGIRKMIVKGFYVYSWIDESNKTITVTAVVYGRRDQISASTEMDDE